MHTSSEYVRRVWDSVNSEFSCFHSKHAIGLILSSFPSSTFHSAKLSLQFWFSFVYSLSFYSYSVSHVRKLSLFCYLSLLPFKQTYWICRGLDITLLTNVIKIEGHFQVTLFVNQISKKILLSILFNIPGVAGAVLQTPLSLIHSFIKWVSLFLQIFTRS